MRQVGLYEKALRTKERNAIPDELFGLPKERKYPLNDEAHVRKAIQFFKHCEAGKRNELAKNINKRARELKMTFNISKDSPFFNYAARDILVESLDIGLKIDYCFIDEMEPLEGTREYYEDIRSQLKKSLLINSNKVEESFVEATNIINGLLNMDHLSQTIFKGALDFRLTESEIYEIQELYDLTSISAGFDNKNNILHYGNHPEKGLCILARTNDKPCLVNIGEASINLDGTVVKDTIRLIISNRVFKPRDFSVIDTVTEGINIAKNGDIKITISPKKSYMDEYSENHRILKNNLKNKNYDAMKANIAFAFMMISVIEREKNYKSNEDLMKARQFFMNDFVMYLDEVQKHEPSFDFARYYNENEFDKYIVNIPVDTISGIKRIIMALIGESKNQL